MNYFNPNKRRRLPTAPNPTTAAAIAKPVSKALTALRTGTPTTGAGRGAGAGAGAERGLGVAAGRVGAGAAATVGGVEGRGAGAAGMTGAAGVTTTDAGAEPAGGKVGNLIVAVGFGGKLMRTVSFFGCTFAASAGFGGTPLGFGLFSAINLLCDFKLKLPLAGVKLIFSDMARPKLRRISPAEFSQQTREE
jgi:hypothetical protein